jgi:hypothetical protein
VRAILQPVRVCSSARVRVLKVCSSAIRLNMHARVHVYLLSVLDFV